VMEKLVRFGLLTRDITPIRSIRYRERRESAKALSKRVNLKSI